MAHKYKIGDYVRVRPNLILYKEYGGVALLHGMAQNCGRVGKITKIAHGSAYVLDFSTYIWTVYMLEPADSPFLIQI